MPDRRAAWRTYFGSVSHNTFYVLGFIFADGCVQSTEFGDSIDRLTVTSKDFDILDRILGDMQSDHVVYERYDGKLCSFALVSKELVDDLISFGCVPRKSCVVDFPSNVPVKYIPDFIRGVFDGDGSVFMVKYYSSTRAKYSPAIGSTFSSASMQFINGIRRHLMSAGVGKGHLQRGKSVYCLRYAHEDSCRLFRYMYHDKMGNMFLKRKYDKFVEIFKLRGDM